MCAALRRTVSAVPSPLFRLGMDENTKIIEAHATTGSHSWSVRGSLTGP
jgi:hypothetical protein